MLPILHAKTQTVNKDLIFLKLGGSLITDKTQPRTARPVVLSRLATEIANACSQNFVQKLIIGHGAGSYGHVPASKYCTRQGVHTPQEWMGFSEVWWEAYALNRLVMDALHNSNLPVIALPPSTSVLAENGEVVAWNTSQIVAGLNAGLIPVIHGDVIFDTRRGGTILSTEDLFTYLARQLRPGRILLAGLEEGVWADYPTCTRLLNHITPADLVDVAPALRGSTATDVTGGMASKVHAMVNLANEIPGLEIMIFSGEKPGYVQEALCGKKIGTLLSGN